MDSIKMCTRVSWDVLCFRLPRSVQCHHSSAHQERQHKLVDAQIQQTLEEMLNDGSGMKRSLSSMTLHLGSAGNLQLLQPSTVGLIAQAAPKKLHLSGLVIQSKSLAALIDKELESLSISDGLLPTQAEQEEL
eukprot:1159968-Pelagomonas_calceolata.AAC.13